jgi:hypothetical protein
MLHAWALFLLASSSPQDIRGPEIQPARNRVVSLDGNHEVVVDLRFVDSGVEGRGDRMFCNRPCRGNVHLLHNLCDFSCDGPCPAGGTHSVEVKPHRLESFSDEVELDAWTAGLRTFGSGIDPVVGACDILNNACQDFHQAVAATAITVNRQCWVDKPCSYHAKDVVLRYFTLVADWRLRRTNIIDGKPVHTFGPRGTLSLYEVGIPQRRTTDSGTITPNCGCQGTAITPAENGIGFIGGGTSQTGGGAAGTGGGTTPRRPQTGEFNDEPRVPEQAPPVQVTPKDPNAVRENPNGQIGFLPQCQNMNVAYMAGTNPFKTDLTVRMRPGTVFDTDEDGIQDVILVMAYMWVLRGVDEPQRGPNVLEQAAQKPLQIMCLDMSKREPNPNVKYRLLPNPDPMLVRIASMVNPITVGVQDQARIWVYTDGATYAQIAEKLIPPPDRGQYVKAVHDLKAAGADLRQDKFNGCFDPANLNAPTDRRTAVKWYVEELLRRNPQGFFQWAESRADFSEALAADKKGESYAHIGRIARVLYLTFDPRAQQAALLMLKNRVPASARERLAKENLKPVFSLASSPDKAVAGLAGEVAAMYAQK